MDTNSDLELCPMLDIYGERRNLSEDYGARKVFLRKGRSWPEDFIINNPFSSSLARRSAFCKFQDDLEISYMNRTSVPGKK